MPAIQSTWCAMRSAAYMLIHLGSLHAPGGAAQSSALIGSCILESGHQERHEDIWLHTGGLASRPREDHRRTPPRAQVIGDTGGMDPADACAALAMAIAGSFARRVSRSEMMRPSASAGLIKRTFTMYFERLQACCGLTYWTC